MPFCAMITTGFRLWPMERKRFLAALDSAISWSCLGIEGCGVYHVIYNPIYSIVTMYQVIPWLQCTKKIYVQIENQQTMVERAF